MTIRKLEDHTILTTSAPDLCGFAWMHVPMDGLNFTLEFKALGVYGSVAVLPINSVENVGGPNGIPDPITDLEDGFAVVTGGPNVVVYDQTGIITTGPGSTTDRDFTLVYDSVTPFLSITYTDDTTTNAFNSFFAQPFPKGYILRFGAKNPSATWSNNAITNLTYCQ